MIVALEEDFARGSFHKLSLETATHFCIVMIISSFRNVCNLKITFKRTNVIKVANFIFFDHCNEEFYRFYLILKPIFFLQTLVRTNVKCQTTPF